MKFLGLELCNTENINIIYRRVFVSILQKDFIIPTLLSILRQITLHVKIYCTRILFSVRIIFFFGHSMRQLSLEWIFCSCSLGIRIIISPDKLTSTRENELFLSHKLLHQFRLIVKHIPYGKLTPKLIRRMPL